MVAKSHEPASRTNSKDAVRYTSPAKFPVGP